MTSLNAIEWIEQATSPAELFNGHTFRSLAKLCHPDILEDKGLLARAQAAFVKLTEFHEAHSATPVAEVVKIGKWGIQGPLAKGEICDIYRVSDGTRDAVLKVARDAADNDLLERERGALAKLTEAGSSFCRYLPTLIESLDVGERKANAFGVAERSYSLKELRSFWPDGLDFRHVVWMGNRLWSLLGYAHRKGILHGAVHPEHLLYRPVDHGLTVIDWCCAVIDGTNEPVPLVSVAWEPHYPPEIRRKRPEPSTDIYMAAKAMVYAAAGKMPKGFGGLLDWCMADSPKSRPTDAWEVQDQWKARAEQEYGPAKFVALEVPKQ